jgi:glycosyltransferase involved in cell wall biosynthesis
MKNFQPIEDMQSFEDISFRGGAASGVENPSKEVSKNKLIKVLIVAPTLDTSVGGQAVQASRLLEKLNEEPNLSVGIQSISPKFLPQLQRVKFLRTAVTQVKFWFDILTKIPKYDVIHIFSSAHFSFLLAPTASVVVAKIFGKKTILNYRSGQIKRHFTNWSRTLKPTLRLFDRIVVPSKYLVDKFAEYDFKARAIYNFVDADRFSFKVRKKLRPVFLSNRLLEELYNIPCILRAFAVVQKKYPQAKLIVAGYGAERGRLENLARELKLENVEFIGAVEQENMPALYDAVDVYLNSPNTDNMPGSIIECFAAGVPIVTTNAGGIPYILEHEKTGLMVAVNDHETMAREMMRLLENGELAREIIGNARRACKKFTWEAVRLEWTNLYSELMNENVDKH